ncbi:phosphate/phosphite/phosphonate ABC transporter substrate-binding protein [Rhodococcus spongiicola]|uniref:Phosphate/phosphite/phosphonate ABC transporter substrate-binding protein n=1 Tax=Rhodococcus spongiicola TaxID=2487352 RepID=A0A3S3A8Z1_9NOCA|nr:phosphate/phosphite/phosphonate ABC transporter substrate-binding protein [Rhodococcus spongiicola]RVW02398.1 phosphate/phosphite/phosphonate ABC transporter substrate-binding protein [Rhodococcus spongiicola]
MGISNFRRNKVVAGVIALLALPLVACGVSSNEPTETIRLGLSPDEDSAAVLAKYEPLVEYLSDATGLKVEPYVGADYTAVIEALNSGHLDMAWFGPSEYVLATQRVQGGVEPFASAVQTDDSMPYRSSFVVRSDSGIDGPEDFQGKVIAFTDPASTSGHVFGQYALAEAGYDVNSLFSQVVYSGSHDASLLSLLNGRVDVAAISSRKVPGFIRTGVAGPDEIKIVLESEEIPADPITYRPDLPEQTKELLRRAFLDETPALSAALEGTGFASFGSVNDSDYDVVRTAYKVSGLEPEL